MGDELSGDELSGDEVPQKDVKSFDTCLLSVEAVVEVVGFVNHQDLAPGFLQHGVGLLLRLADDCPDEVAGRRKNDVAG